MRTLLSIDRVDSLVGDICLVKLDKDQNLRIKTKGGLELVNDTLYTRIDDSFIPPDEYLPQEGEIVALPKRNVQGSLSSLRIGDRVLLHHFVCSQEMLVRYDGDECYFFRYYRDFLTYKTSNVYCKVDGDRVKEMVDGWNFVKLCEDEIKIGVFEKKYVNEKRGILEEVNGELGLKKGDEVVINPNGMIRIYFGGVERWLIHNTDIWAVYQSSSIGESRSEEIVS